MAPRTIKVLLVEDNPGDARLVLELVRETGAGLFDFEHVDRLGEAERRLRTGHFDLVLLDLSLPDSQGLVTVTRAREHSRSTPIVVLTGLADEQIAVDALQAGAQDYLVKGQTDGHSTVRAMRYAIERAGRERAELLHKTRAAQVWKSLFRILGPGAPAILYRAGADAGSNTFDYVIETWKPPDDDSFVRAVREHLHSAGLCDLRDLRLERQGQRAIAVIHDSFEAGQYGLNAPTPVCHFLRGLLGGLVNRMTEIPDVVCDELKCQAKGDAACEFAVHRMLG